MLYTPEEYGNDNEIQQTQTFKIHELFLQKL